jgi:hypothetical protein
LPETVLLYSAAERCDLLASGEWVGGTEAARLLGADRKFVSELRELGLLPGSVLTSNGRLYPRSAVEAIAETASQVVAEFRRNGLIRTPGGCWWRWRAAAQEVRGRLP